LLDCFSQLPNTPSTYSFLELLGRLPPVFKFRVSLNEIVKRELFIGTGDEELLDVFKEKEVHRLLMDAG
jgi:hypothetical protein